MKDKKEEPSLQKSLEDRLKDEINQKKRELKRRRWGQRKEKVKDGAKSLFWRNIFAVGFGAYHGITNGEFSSNAAELQSGGFYFGLLFPIGYKIFGRYMPGREEPSWRETAINGAMGTTAYMLAYNVAQLLRHGHM